MVHSEKHSSSVRLREGPGEEHGKTGSSRARQVPNHDGLVSHERRTSCLPPIKICGFSVAIGLWIFLYFLDNHYNKNIRI